MKKRLKSLVESKLFKSRRAKILLIIILIVLSGGIYIFKDLPSPTKLAASNLSKATQIYDRNGILLYTIYQNKNQTFVPLSSIPKQLQEATIAIEDRNFYTHGAIDIKGIARSLFSIIFHQQIEGGSTITQQLVKTSLLTPERTLTRKIKEAILSFATEIIYPKDKILEMYLNQVPYGGAVIGIEAASETYFNKHAKDLSLSEASLLAGLPESPTAYSPFGAHPELAKQRQKEVLNAMVEEKYITQKQATDAYNQPLHYQMVANRILAPHFVLYVKDLLEKKYGAQLVETGGLKVITSLDYSIQSYAQDTVAKEVAGLKGYNVSNGAVLVTKPQTGEILAMVGSKDYFNTSIDGNVNITLALRQPGSSIKPINYAVGLLKGYTAATPFIDAPVCFPTRAGEPDYCPVNYDGKWHGVLQMRYALGNSINIPAVKMLKLNGVDAMVATASAMGITTFTDPDRYGLSLTLGGGEVTMLQMAEAYGVFANQGYRIPLHPILKVTDRNGNVLEEYKPPQSAIFGTKVLPSGVTFIISDILADNNARLLEFGANSALRIPNQIVSVKTGTTNDFRDNWTIGYTPSFVVAAWVGNDDNTPMSDIASGITGAAPIWNDIMSYLLAGRPPEPMGRPSSVIQKRICSLSGLLPEPDGTPNRCETRFEYFIKGTEPQKTDIPTQIVSIDRSTNDLANPGQTTNVDQRPETVVTDATGQNYCVTCPHLYPTPTP